MTKRTKTDFVAEVRNAHGGVYPVFVRETLCPKTIFAIISKHVAPDMIAALRYGRTLTADDRDIMARSEPGLPAKNPWVGA